MTIHPQMQPVSQEGHPSQPSQHVAVSSPSQRYPMQQPTSSPVPTPSPTVIKSKEKRPRPEVVSQTVIDFCSALYHEFKTPYVDRNTVSHGKSNKKQKQDTVSGSGSGSGNGSGSGGGSDSTIVNRNTGTGGSGSVSGGGSDSTIVNSNTSTGSGSNINNNDNDNTNDNHKNVANHFLDRHSVINIDDEDQPELEQDEEEAEAFDEGADIYAARRITTGFWAKPDVIEFVMWLTDEKNSRRYLKPGDTLGTSIIDVRKEAAEFVNAAMADLAYPSPPFKPWNGNTVHEKFRYINAQYDRCVKLIKKKTTYGRKAESSALEKATSYIIPYYYYHKLATIFGGPLIRDHLPPAPPAPPLPPPPPAPPRRDSATLARATVIPDESADFEERVPGSVSLSSSSRTRSRPRLRPDRQNDEHELYASLMAIVSEFTALNSAIATGAGGSQETTRYHADHMESALQLKREWEELNDRIQREDARMESEREDLEERIQRENARIARDKEDLEYRVEYENARMERERRDFRIEINRQREMMEEMRQDFKEAKIAFQTEKARFQEDVVEFTAKNKDREMLVRTLAKYRVLVDGRAGVGSSVSFT